MIWTPEIDTDQSSIAIAMSLLVIHTYFVLHTISIISYLLFSLVARQRKSLGSLIRIQHNVARNRWNIYSKWMALSTMVIKLKIIGFLCGSIVLYNFNILKMNGISIQSALLKITIIIISLIKIILYPNKSTY